MKEILWSCLIIFLGAIAEVCGSMSPEVVKAVEMNLLSLLKLPKRPSVDKTKAFFPAYMMELYRKQMKSQFETVTLSLPGKHTQSANTATAFFHTGAMDADKGDGANESNTIQLFFDISTLSEKDKITGAELRLSLMPDKERKTGERRYETVKVSDIIRPEMKGSKERIIRLIDTKEVNVEDGMEVSLDVLPAVEKWQKNKAHNFGVLVQVKTKKSKTKPALRLRRSVPEEDEENWKKIQPVLYVYSDDGRNKRKGIEKIREKRDERRVRYREPCRRKPLYIDFEAVGWSDWIQAPNGYDAYMCSGHCQFPLPDKSNSTNYAIIQAMLHSVHPNKVQHKVCCVPVEYEPISLLYLYENKPILKTYAEMVVTACGCR